MGTVEPVYDDNGKVRAYRARWRERSGRQRKKQFRLKGQADKHIIAMEDAKAKRVGDRLDPKVTVDELVGEYIELMTAELAESSIESMQWRRKSFITGTPFGRATAIDTTFSDVKKWTQDTRAKSAANTTRNTLTLVRSALAVALRDGRITENPAAHKIKVKGEERSEDDEDSADFTALEINDVAKILAAIPNPRWRIIAAVQAHTGLRVQEALGLKVKEVDLDAREIRVRMQLHRRRRVRVKLKTDSSWREVALGDVLVELLRDYFAEHPPTSEYAFTDEAGHPWLYDHYRRPVERAGASVGLKVSTHDFRHHHASVLIMRNVNLFAIAKRLGHASVVQLERTYGHVLEQVDDVTRDAIDGAWRDDV